MNFLEKVSGIVMMFLVTIVLVIMATGRIERLENYDDVKKQNENMAFHIK